MGGLASQQSHRMTCKSYIIIIIIIIVYLSCLVAHAGFSIMYPPLSRDYVLANPRFQVLKAVAEASKDKTFLETYR